MPSLGKSPWRRHVEKWSKCQLCPLCSQRGKVVLLRGDIPCDVLFVGEAPGMSEDRDGRPFWGPAGKYQDTLIEQVFRRLDRPDGEGGRFVATRAYTNLVGCFPAEAKKTEDHRPPRDAIRACAPRLREVVEMCRPKLIVCVGTLAKDWLHLAVDEASEDYEIIAVPHPSAILQAPSVNKPLLIEKYVVTLTNALERMQEKYNDKAIQEA